MQKTWMVKRRQWKRSLAKESAEARAVARIRAEAGFPTSTRALILMIAEARARAAHVEVVLEWLKLARPSRPFAAISRRRFLC